MNELPAPDFPVTTSDTLPAHRIVGYCGLARGNSVRAASVPRDLVARMQNMVGGEIPEYTRILAQCREEAMDRMIEHARAMGANAIIAMRFATSEIATEAAELLAYGTAVRVETGSA